MGVPEAPAAAEVRRQVREWRRGRAVLGYRDALGDAYVALPAVVMVGSMAVSVVLDLRRLADSSCEGSCAQVRLLGPWLCALAVAALALGAARLVGPVFSPPAVNAWVLSTPVDRGRLLRPGWWRTVALTVVGSTLVLLVPALLGAFRPATATAFVAVGVAASLACLAVAARSQRREDRWATRLTWLVAGTFWLLLALVGGNRIETVPIVSVGTGLALAAVCLLLAASLVWRVDATLATTSRRVLGHTEHLSLSLSGAFSALDLGLMFDLLLARRWSSSARVSSRTGGPRGWWALLHRDLRRLLRAPQPYLVLGGAVLVPYAAAAAGAGRALALVSTLTGLVLGPPLCAGLRVVVRTQGLARVLPLSGAALRSAHVVVPGSALVAFGLATTGALLPTMPPGEAVVVALGCGFSALAATIRWITAQPPDYSQPMLSTPAGAVPPGAVLSVLRGFDVWLATALPLMFAGWGGPVSLLLSLCVIAYLILVDPA